MGEAKAPSELCHVWATKTFGKAVEETFWKDSNIREKLREQLAALKILDEKVTGNAIIGLERTRELGGGINYTETFFEVLNATQNCNPIDYLYLLVKKSSDRGNEFGKTTGILARSMRTLASLLKDMDFAVLMERKIKKNRLFEGAEIKTSAEEDLKNHTDILFKIKGREYRIWLFQYSPRGLPHDIERITGMRGPLPSGAHIISPIKLEKAMELDRKLNSMRTMEGKIREIEQIMKETNERAKKHGSLVERKGAWLAKLNARAEEIKKLKSEVKVEVTEAEGWYFYSEEKIDAVLNLIKEIESGIRQPKNYKEVCEILGGPSTYLSQLSSFRI